MPTDLPAAWALLGEAPRAEALVMSIADPTERLAARVALAPAMVAIDVEKAFAILREITGTLARTVALTGMIQSLAIVDQTSHRNRAQQLVEEAKQTAALIADVRDQAKALVALAAATAAFDVHEAQTIAGSITTANHQVEALAAIARKIVATDPIGAARIVDEAQETADAIPHHGRRLEALVALSPAMAMTNVDKAVAIIESLDHQDACIDAIIATAPIVAPVNPQLAMSLAAAATNASVSSGSYHVAVKAWDALISSAAHIDFDKAETLAAGMGKGGRYKGDQALALLIRAVSMGDPARFDRLVQTIIDERCQFAAIRRLTSAAETSDTAMLQQMAQIADKLTWSITDTKTRMRALVAIAPWVNTINRSQSSAMLQEVERIARTIIDPTNHAQEQADLVPFIAALDTGRALQTARSISVDYLRDWALRDLALLTSKTDPQTASEMVDEIERNLRSTSTVVLRSWIMW